MRSKLFSMVQILCGVNFGTKRKRRISRRSGISPFDTILGGVWISCLSQSFGPWLKGGGGVKTQMAPTYTSVFVVQKEMGGLVFSFE